MWLVILPAILVSQNFTWVRGSTSSSVAGVYGTQGVSAPGNDPGGRHGCATWTDAQGNMWLFGGEGYSSNLTLCLLNDLWKYNPVTNQWTWIRGSAFPNPTANYGTQGVASPINDPGAREFSASWTDAAGNFWLYGGSGVTTNSTVGYLTDLWKYDPTTNQWTWVKGPSGINSTGIYGTLGVASPANQPGGRYWPATWVDNSGKFWVLGGRGYSANLLGRLNDLWRFDPTTNNWTWMGGSANQDTPGTYGTQGVAAASNFPGARDRASFFVSDQGHLVLFGGQGFASTAAAGLLNDLWDYNISAGTWTWLKGSNMPSPLTVYGTQGQASALVTPGGRAASAFWADMMGNYWVFAGTGVGSTFSTNRQNDLFMYNPNTNNWTWISGSNQGGQNGTYGTQGVAAPGNVPGARDHNSCWRVTSSGYLWLIGGEGYDATSNFFDHMNDLWKFKVPCNPDSVKAVVPSPLCSGSTVSLTAYNLYPSKVFWYTSPTGTVSVGAGSAFTTPTLAAGSTPSVYTWYAGYLPCPTSTLASFNVTVLPLPQLSASAPASLCPGQSGTIVASGAISYLWSTGSQTGSISVVGGTGVAVTTFTGTGSNGCSSSATVAVGAYPVPVIGAVSSHPISCMNETITLTASGATSYTWNGNSPSQSIAVSPTISTTYTVTGVNQYSCTSTHTITQLVVSCLGIDDPTGTVPAPEIYPNPGNGELTVKTELAARLTFSDATGRLLFTTDAQPGIQQIATGLMPGVYTCRIDQDDGQHYVLRVVVR